MQGPTASIPFEYRQPLWGQFDRALRNCWRGAALVGLLVLVTIFVVPRPDTGQLSLEQVPERFARLIVEKPQAPVAVPRGPEKVAQLDATEEPAPVKAPEPAAIAPPRPRERTTTRPVDPSAGRKGRELGQTQVANQLQEVQGSLDQALASLSSALPAAREGSSAEGTQRRPARAVRGGKGRNDLAQVGGVETTAAAADCAGSGGGSLEGTAAGGGGELRSNASLLAVVRRYAAGIQFCYDNELKREPGLRGKLVISLTVLATGEVSEAVVVQDDLRNRSVVDCVLAQIHSWRFGAIEQGVVSFRTPFVFTPPE